MAVVAETNTSLYLYIQMTYSDIDAARRIHSDTTQTDEMEIYT